MAKASTEKTKVPERAKDFITVNDRDGVHEHDVDLTPRASEEIWKAIGKHVDLSAASSFVAVIVAPPAKKT